jgi:hypothetical protein
VIRTQRTQPADEAFIASAARAAERRLRELRAWVKGARAVVATTPGLAEVLLLDRRRAARFCARFGITEDYFHRGVRFDAESQGTYGVTP